MALEYFGKDFDYCFYPLRTDGCTYELLTADPPTIYLFDSKPTVEEAANGTDAIETVNTWVDTEDANGKKIAFSAVPKPADLNAYSKKYYVAINTALQTGQTIEPVIKEITLQDLRSHESIIEVSISDIVGIEPQIKLFCKCLGDLELFIDAAVKDVKMSVSSCDFNFQDLTDPGVLNKATTELAISKFFYSQSREVGDIHWSNGIRYNEAYEKSLKQAQLQFDKNRDGIVDGVRSAPRGIRSLRILR